MNAFNNHTTIASPAARLQANLVIGSLAAELHAVGEIMTTLRFYGTLPQLLHAKIDLKQRGVIDEHLLRAPERKAVLSIAAQYLAQHTNNYEQYPCPGVSSELVRRLRMVAGQSTIKPPAIDLEAADHIEKLQRYIDDSPATHSASDGHRLRAGINFVHATSSPDAIRPDFGDRRFWPVDLATHGGDAPPSPAVLELVSILEGALADDLVQYHSREWLARARSAIEKHRSPTATAPQQSTPEKRIE